MNKAAIQDFIRKQMKKAPEFGVSLFVHLIAFSMLALWVIETQGPAKVATVFSDIEEQKVQEDFTEEMKEEEIDLETPVSLNTSSATGGTAGSAADLAAMGNPTQATVQTAAAAAVLTDRAFNRPLAVGAGDLGLDSNVSGLKGDTEGGLGGSGDGDGDGGAIDKITLEILRQLSKNKVLVAWIMDSTESLKPRREAIAKKFDRVYHELDQLGVNKDDALMTTIVSTGNETKFLIDQPTNDVAVIRKAINSMGDDGTGIENFFTSIRETATKYRRFQTSGRRTLMIVLLTDEVGNDTNQADETTALLKRNEVPLYVLGPMASFSRETIHDTWVDPKTKFRFWLPMQRGPYTRREELARCSQYGEQYVAAGFGPFALTQLSRETGGIFFIYSDQRLKTPDFHKEILMRYKASYVDAKDYQKECAQSSLRRALMEVSDQCNKTFGQHFTHHWIHEQVWKESVDQRQAECSRYLSFADKAIPMLDQVAAEWDRETAPRWQANFDISFARILVNKVRADEMNWAAADFKLNPMTLKDPKTNNGWHVEWTEEMHVGTKPGQKSDSKTEKAGTTNVTKGGTDSKAKDENRKLLEKALFHYQRILDQHAGTPWHYCAKSEMTRKVGVNWKEGFDPHYVRLEDRKARNAVKPPKI